MSTIVPCMSFDPISGKPYKRAVKYFRIDGSTPKTPHKLEEIVEDGIDLPTVADVYTPPGFIRTENLHGWTLRKSEILRQHLDINDIDKNDIKNAQLIKKALKCILDYSVDLPTPCRPNIVLLLPYSEKFYDRCGDEFQEWFINNLKKIISLDEGVSEAVDILSKQVLHYKGVINSAFGEEYKDSVFAKLNPEVLETMKTLMEKLKKYSNELATSLFNNYSKQLPLSLLAEFLGLAYSTCTIIVVLGLKNTIKLWETTFPVNNTSEASIMVDLLYHKVSHVPFSEIVAIHKTDVYGVNKKVLGDICLNFFEKSNIHRNRDSIIFLFMRYLAQSSCTVDVPNDIGRIFSVFIIDVSKRFMLSRRSVMDVIYEFYGKDNIVMHFSNQNNHVKYFWGRYLDVVKIHDLKDKVTIRNWLNDYDEFADPTQNFVWVRALLDLAEDYLNTHMIDMFQQHVNSGVTLLIACILDKLNIRRFQEYLTVEKAYQGASAIVGKVNGIDLVINFTRLDEENDDDLRANRRVRVPSSISKGIKNLLAPYHDDREIRLNKNYQKVELVMNMGEREITIICTAFIYGILSAFEDRDKCEIGLLEKYASMETNHFKSTLQKLRNHRILQVKSGNVYINTDVKDLPGKIVIGL